MGDGPDPALPGDGEMTVGDGLSSARPGDVCEPALPGDEDTTVGDGPGSVRPGDGAATVGDWARR